MALPTSDRKERGQHAENLALEHLSRSGLRCLARNFRCKLGEIDLVMADRREIVFVEVRFRRQLKFGHPAATVDARKQRKLINTAQVFMQKYDPALKYAYRFDVVAISGDLEHRPQIDWVSPAF